MSAIHTNWIPVTIRAVESWYKVFLGCERGYIEDSGDIMGYAYPWCGWTAGAFSTTGTWAIACSWRSGGGAMSSLFCSGTGTSWASCVVCLRGRGGAMPMMGGCCIPRLRILLDNTVSQRYVTGDNEYWALTVYVWPSFRDVRSCKGRTGSLGRDCCGSIDIWSCDLALCIERMDGCPGYVRWIG